MPRLRCEPPGPDRKGEHPDVSGPRGEGHEGGGDDAGRRRLTETVLRRGHELHGRLTLMPMNHHHDEPEAICDATPRASGLVLLQRGASMEGADEPTAAAPQPRTQDEMMAQDDFGPNDWTSLEIHTLLVKMGRKENSAQELLSAWVSTCEEIDIVCDALSWPSRFADALFDTNAACFVGRREREVCVSPCRLGSVWHAPFGARPWARSRSASRR